MKSARRESAKRKRRAKRLARKSARAAARRRHLIDGPMFLFNTLRLVAIGREQAAVLAEEFSKLPDVEVHLDDVTSDARCVHVLAWTEDAFVVVLERAKLLVGEQSAQ